ncbi:MAG: hypothetical protein ABI533_02805 [Betaproteobacteria bacterium]
MKRGRSARRRAVGASAAIFFGAWLAIEPCIARPAGIPADVAPRLAALDCARVDAAGVRDVLARVPAPRIVLLQGSVPIVTMAPFGRFLIAMGYPRGQLVNPRDGELSYTSSGDAAELAGALAFDYERSGLEPMLIGHSQGGMQAIRVLYVLAGAFGDTVEVVDSSTGQPLGRTTIVDPFTHAVRPVVGLHVAYASALATGWLPRVVLGQWSMLGRLRKVPDTADEFTGFDIPNDPIAGNLFGIAPYAALGTANVRNVVLPSSYGHIDLPRAEALADDDALRRWIDDWQPESTAVLPPGDTRNIVHAADVWHSVKRQWCVQAQRLLRLPPA